MKGEIGPFNSTFTRVVPVFDALSRLDGNLWLASLLRLAEGGHPQAKISTTLDCTLVVPPFYGKTEKALAASKSLLRWLVENVTDWSGTAISTSGSTADLRQRLIDRYRPTIDEALALLNGKHAKKGWHILEGASYPDVYLETSDVIVVIEGKRTEPMPTTSTKWMPVRHQMLRHLDGAWDIRGDKKVYGMFIVDEMVDAYTKGVWRDAAAATLRPEILAESLPHRTPSERESIAKSFLGIATWQQILRKFNLPHSLLIDRLH